MSILNNSLLLGTAAGAAGYQISRSLRFNSADSAFLSRTPASAGNRKTWTWSGWVKLNNSSSNFFWGAGPTSGQTNYNYARFGVFNDKIQFLTAGQYIFTSTAVYRDYSAWGHITLVCDTTQAVAADRLKVYYNSVAVTNTAPATLDLNGDYAFNAAEFHAIGSESRFGSWSGYLADVHFIDGQALTPSSFAETNATTGQWVPKAYTGSYGTNGFRLDFSDNSAATATTLGKDRAGSNNWTPNNLSVTAGTGNDSLVDTPTSYGTDTGAGGEVRGNYSTWNALYKLPTTYTPMTLSNGNLDLVSPNASGIAGCPCVLSTVAASSGKYFFEVNVATAGNMLIGIAQASYIPTNEGGTGAGALSYYVNGSVFNSSNSSTAYGASYTSGDVIGVAFDADAKTCTFYKNGSSQGQLSWTFGTPVTPLIGDYGGVSTCSASANFGQRPFAYTAPSGFKALCDTNLPAPVVAKPSTVMDVKLYTGNGSTQTISGLGFSPDFVWIKGRSFSPNHRLYDQIRGATKSLSSDLTSVEGTESTGLTAFTSDGFSLGGQVGHNGSGDTYVGWCWDAGTTTTTNTQGSITSQVRANASAGFSIVTWTGTGVNATVGHGLGVAPQLIIVKARVATANTSWAIYHVATGASAWTSFTTDATLTGVTGTWNSTSPTSTVFSVGTFSVVNESAKTYVAYCFAPVAGYSAFGSYTGNGSADGPFVYTGFRPRFVMIKNSGATANWLISDSARDPSNLVKNVLLPNLSNAEDTAADYVDFVSNGFKIKAAPSAAYNASGNTYVFVAFAEFPFQYARAR